MADDFLTPFLTRIAQKVSGVSANDLTSAMVSANLQQALKEYSRTSPKILIKDITADGSYEYSLPTEWVDGFSALQQIEYPAGVMQDPHDAIVPPEKYGVYNATKIRFYSISPAAGKIIRTTFSIPHSVATEASTVYANDVDSVCSLAAAYCCFDLARKYAQDNESFISADSVDRKTKSEKYLALGKSLVTEFAIHFGLNKDAEVMAGSSAKNLDINYPGGLDQLTHPAIDR